MKIAHIIPTLGAGGAERSLTNLITSDVVNEHLVYVFSSASESAASNIQMLVNSKVRPTLCYLGDGTTSYLSMMSILRAHLRASDPNIVVSWMYHLSVTVAVVLKVFDKRKIIWNLRNGEIIFRSQSYRTSLVMLLGGVLSHFIPEKIIVAARRSIDVHSRMGYARKKFFHINNGINFSGLGLNRRIYPNTGSIPTIGFVARCHQQKNHDRFFKALMRLGYRVEVILAGEGTEVLGSLYPNLINKGIGISFLGQVKDVSALYSSLDLLILPSIFGEATPNVILEAMYTGIPCVVSDVGDSAEIVGQFGYVIEDPFDVRSIRVALVRAVNDFLYAPHVYCYRCTGSHKRVTEKFSMQRTLGLYQAVFSDVNAY